jgi:catechol 2,3-dioxygenase-like lactoylglutathione lyase family enzyme
MEAKMAAGILEHTNYSVSDPQKTADMLCKLFGWHIRWSGASIDNGHTVHVGGDDSYLAVYAQAKMRNAVPNDYKTVGVMNHVGIAVEDLDAVEARVVAAGLEPINHADYEPGRRFYFHDHDGIEYEVVSYG